MEINFFSLFLLFQSVPHFSACVMFEMRNIDNVPHIEIFLKNSSPEAVPLHIPRCGVPCSLADFYELYRDVLPTESFEKECAVESSAGQSGTY